MTETETEGESQRETGRGRESERGTEPDKADKRIGAHWTLGGKGPENDDWIDVCIRG